MEQLSDHMEKDKIESFTQSSLPCGFHLNGKSKILKQKYDLRVRRNFF